MAGHLRQPESGATPEVAPKVAGEGETPGGSSLSVKEDVGLADDATLEKDRQFKQTTVPPSRESSVSPHHPEGNGSASALAASSLVMSGAGQQRRQPRSSSCSTCTCSAPRDQGRRMSMMYCILLVLIATVIPITEGLQKAWLTEITVAAFLAYLYGISILFILFVEIYLLRRAKKRRKERKLKRQERADDILPEADKSIDSGGKSNLAYTSQQSIPQQNGKGRELADYDDLDNKSIKSEVSNVTELFMGDTDPELNEPLPNRLSLFHRIAAAVFALGLMIYMGLLLKQLHEHHSPAACKSNMIWPHYLQLAFLLLQTFFIFKHSQLALRSWQPFFRLGLLHLVATNWSVLIRSVVRETLDSYLKHNIRLHRSQSDPSLGVSAFSPCYDEGDILYKASPYIYTCILQYSLLAMAATIALYLDVGYIAPKDDLDKIEEYETAESENKRLSRSYSQQATAVNFHKTHQGLFAGLVIMAATFVSVILFFSYLESDPAKPSTISVMIYYVSDIGLHVILFIVVAIGWLRMKRLSFLWPPEGVVVDEGLILVAMAGSILYRLFKVVSTFKALIGGKVDSNIILTFCDMVLAIGLNLFQTSFVLDSFSRRSTSRRHLKDKPGRGSVTFLLVANLTVWAFRMFQLKETRVEGSAIEEATYGFITWEIILRLLLPLSIFYHYTSSASFARVWTDAYRKETVKETLKREAEEQAEALRKSKSMELHFFPRPSPIMRVIELRRRFRKRDEPEMESESVWSPVSDV